MRWCFSVLFLAPFKPHTLVPIKMLVSCLTSLNTLCQKIVLAPQVRNNLCLNQSLDWTLWFSPYWLFTLIPMKLKMYKIFFPLIHTITQVIVMFIICLKFTRIKSTWWITKCLRSFYLLIWWSLNEQNVCYTKNSIHRMNN